MTRVKMRYDYQALRQGHVYDLPQDVAADLVKRGLAVAVKSAKRGRPKKETGNG